jgi:hypothetical protein
MIACAGGVGSIWLLAIKFPAPNAHHLVATTLELVRYLLDRHLVARFPK